jgi:dihydrofolate synthase / folylpolyglutamate synthase
MKPLISEIEPSFFELTVAMAFEYFAKQEVDIAVVEVGLGGRLDSTNVITPEVSVITNISYDHMNILGNTLEQIAAEKAGIIKPGVPVVVGESHPATRPVFEKAAAEKKAPFIFADDYYKPAGRKMTLQSLEITVSGGNERQYAFQSGLFGLYQERNIITVLTAVEELRKKGFQVSDTHMNTAIARVKELTGLEGRWEVIHRQPLVVLDVAHNEAGLSMIMKQLELCRSQFNSLHIVLGMVKDKDVNSALAVLSPGAAYYFTQAQTPRALDAHSLKRKAKPFGLKGAAYSNINEALDAAIRSSAANDLVLVCGSVFLVGEVESAYNGTGL